MEQTHLRGGSKNKKSRKASSLGMESPVLPLSSVTVAATWKLTLPVPIANQPSTSGSAIQGGLLKAS